MTEGYERKNIPLKPLQHPSRCITANPPRHTDRKTAIFVLFTHERQAEDKFFIVIESPRKTIFSASAFGSQSKKK